VELAVSRSPNAMRMKTFMIENAILSVKKAMKQLDAVLVEK
jgi:hypothetical protein